MRVQVPPRAPILSKNPNIRPSGRFFGSDFLVPAISKTHFPPPFEKWVLGLRRLGLGEGFVVQKQVQSKDFGQDGFLSAKVVGFAQITDRFCGFEPILHRFYPRILVGCYVRQTFL